MKRFPNRHSNPADHFPVRHPVPATDRQRALRRAAAVLVLAGGLAATGALRAVTVPEYQLVVSKSSQELLVLDGDRVVKRFHIAYGRGGAGTKVRLGDNRTPSGSYRITGFRLDSPFFLFMQLDYPNLQDAWYGYRRDLISAGQFRAIAAAYREGKVPPQDTALGGYIGIHGIGESNHEKLAIHERSNWTEGCIALTNDEIRELRNYVTIGTRVLIRQ